MATTWRRQILIDKMAIEAGISKASAGKALNALLDGIQQALEDGDRVALSGFGTFKTSDRAARMGRNPQTGQPVHIPARRVAGFSAGKHLKDAINSVSRQPTTASW